ncbi:hypothetical protein CALVIDRAFT_598706 [Calocera viscosa TUFC12733]|uniref:Uncharacterized protein n=1 Tax=Calocera viscosa (strain TUFC12733) TaxID=1330018 RepID=A0A167LTC4_CALVF|nr:hypothetical protein CALVIDRAFT_598706 [Calocera viscosa TUFC12733]
MSSTTSRPLPTRSTPPPASALGRSSIARTGSARSSPVNGRPVPPRKLEVADSPTKPLSAKEQLEQQLRREQEEKENLSVKLDDANKASRELESTVASLRSSLQLAESRLSQLSADTLRTEHTLSEQSEIISALRSQLSTVERERREDEKRYREQTAAFEAERQAQWEGEQASRQRFERLEERLRRAEARAVQVGYDVPEDRLREEEETDTPKVAHPPKVEERTEQEEPPEMTMMRLEMDSLSGAYASLQNTHQMLLQEMTDVKRVNQQIQEENESYNVLLRERTLAGTFHLPGTSPYSDSISLDEDVYSKAGSRLDPVSEDAEVLEAEQADEFPPASIKRDSESPVPSNPSSGRQRRRRTSAGSAKGVGESLAGFPVSGPGEDLAAELGRAEARDVVPEVTVESPRYPKKEEGHSLAAMRAEIQGLKDANKALSLYAAKILDRIIAEEGFEHVLAADYKEGTTNALATSSRPERGASLSRSKTVAGHGRRPASTTLAGVRDQPQEQMTPLAAPPMIASKSEPPSVIQTQQAKRRSSIDWKALFGGGTQEKKNESLRPLSLATAAMPAAPKPPTQALPPPRPRFIPRDTEEDEEDRKERERLNATMKLMGIERASSQREREQAADDLSHLDAARQAGALGGTSKGDRRRSSMMLRSPSPNLGASPQQRVTSTLAYRLSSDLPANGGLTSDALAEAGAAHALAELDAEEKRISEQLAKGKAYQGGFTPSARELAEANAESGSAGGAGLMRRSSRRVRSGRESSGTMSVGSVSTVWSAGRASGSSGGDPVLE